MTGPEQRRPEPARADGEADMSMTEAPPTTAIPAALRDAQAVAARVSADEAAADAERVRLVAEPLPILADGIESRVRLRPDEVVHAIRQAALLEDRGAQLPSGGTLYLTSRRLVHAGQEVREIQLIDIEETAVALERLLLIDLADGSDLAVEVEQPRLLRVQLAAARAAAREHGA
jgi:hypothetical protein